jgi:branched-chain amino acid transport system ATP-binding protein
MLEVSDLTVSYGPTAAVRAVNISVAAGEAVGLLGPNGAGKTSSLRAMSGLVGFGGKVVFDGEDLASIPAEHIARRGLIHVPEGRHVFPDLTVHENLQLAQVARGSRTNGYSVSDVYDLFPALRPLSNRQGYALSGGEQQMVAIGRGLVAAPRLLLLDEPSLGLAPIVAAAVFNALKQVRERTPLLVVEQNTALALRVCERAYVLNAGSVVLRGTAAELQDRATLLASYLGQRDTVAAHPGTPESPGTSNP